MIIIKFESNSDVSAFICKILETIDKNNKYYDELKFFAAIHTTTATEYFGELRILLGKIIETNGVPEFGREIKQLYKLLTKILMG